MGNNDPSDLREEFAGQLKSKAVFEQAKRYAFAYLNEKEERPVSPSAASVEALAGFDEPFPEKLGKPDQILQRLHEIGSPATVNQTGGRYFGFVNGSATPVAMAAKWLAAVWDQNSALFVMSPAVAKLEAVCQEWLKELLGLPEETVAGFVSGSSTANLCGIAAGRNYLLKHQGWNVNEQGMAGAPKIRVILGEHAHATVFKALALLGFGTAGVEQVPVDDQGCILVEKMPKLDDCCLVIAQAGNVNSGGFDPLDSICDRAGKAGAWVHVDGAFGLWAAGSKTRSHLTKGIEKADSWAADAHKTLNAPYDCGITLCRKGESLVEAMQLTGSYIQYSDRRDSMIYTPEMSRRSRGVELWATLKTLGKEGVAQLVDGLCEQAIAFSEKLSGQGFRILNQVVFNQVLLACDSPEETQKTLAHIQDSGDCWCGGALWMDEPVIRISLSSWATTPADIDQSVRAFVRSREKARHAG